jgi:peptidoglycan hydrolase-like protein with peptidoglycan-binding domain
MLRWPTIQGGAGWDEVGFEPVVAAVQYQLRARSFYLEEVSGRYDHTTVTAVKAFQKSKGLLQDGIAGPQTLPLLIVPVEPGSKGDAVRAVQIVVRLAKNDICDMPNLGLAVDGLYRKATEDAVRTHKQCLDFMERQLPINGAMDLMSWSLMLYDFKPQTKSPPQAPSDEKLLVAPVEWPTIPEGEELYEECYSPRVAALQYLLREYGSYKASVDGIFGAKTAAAVKEFQHSVREPPTGVADSKVLSHLVAPLELGAYGDMVRAAQILARRTKNFYGEYPNIGLEADGVYGAETVEAIKRAQQCLNMDTLRLPVDGVMTPRSWCLMLDGRLNVR